MASTGGPAIETAGLTKRLGGRPVVDGLDLNVPEGSVFGFLGPNGSGKTTTIRMLLGLVYPSAGRARVLGRELPSGASEVLPAVGAFVEGPAFYPFLSGRENLERLDAVGRRGRGPGGVRTSRADRRVRIDDALARVGLTAAAGKRVRAYSQGMAQRLALAATLVRPIELLVLDEPTNGLDPQGTREVRNLIRKLSAEGITVFVSSHLLSEVEQVCTHAAVLFAGRMVASGSLAELRAVNRPTLRVETPDGERAMSVLRGLHGIGLVTPAPPEGNGARPGETSWSSAAGGPSATVLRAELLGAAPEDVNAALVGDGVRVRALVVEQPSLEELFVSLTGEGFDVAQ